MLVCWPYAVQKIADALHPFFGLDQERAHMAGVGICQSAFGSRCGGVELLAIVWLVGQIVLQVGDDEDGARANLPNHAGRPNIGETRAAENCPKKMMSGTKGNAGRPV